MGSTLELGDRGRIGLPPTPFFSCLLPTHRATCKCLGTPILYTNSIHTPHKQWSQGVHTDNMIHPWGTNLGKRPCRLCSLLDKEF